MLLILQVGCATKYIIPGNRFVTPESQGGAFESSFEFQQTDAQQLTADVSNGTVKDGVLYSPVDRSGFLFQTSFVEQIDFLWNHTGSGNSMFGLKFQVLGASRLAKGTGHKAAIGAAFGGNEHETKGSNSVLFNLQGQEFLFMYGYRFSEFLLLYSNLVHSRYNFEGEISSSDPAIDGLKPSYETKTTALLGGTEITIFERFLAKLEAGYQQLQTTDTKDEMAFLVGYSIGFTW